MSGSRNLRNIGVISFLTVVSRVLGLARDSLTFAVFGVGWLTDAFYTAFSLPNLFRRLLAEGSLTAAFIPTLQEELHGTGEAGAFALLSQVVSWLLVVSGGLVAFAMILLSRSRILSGHEEKWYLAADLAVLLFPYLILICLAAAFNAILNVRQHFTEPALSPIWLNVCMIVSLGGAGLHWARTPLGEVHWLCAGVLAGGFLQMAVPAAVLMRAGWRPRFDLTMSPRVREIAGLMTPGLVGTGIYQINILVSRLLAFSLTESAASSLFAMNRLMEMPIGVFAVAISTVVYPLLAKHAVEGNRKGMADDFLKGLRLILAINVPAAAGLALLRYPIVRLLYLHGKVTPQSAHDMANLLALFAIGMPFFSVVNLTVRAFYAVKDTKTPVKVASIDFVVNVVLSLLLKRWFGVSGLVVASTSAVIVQAVLLERSLTRRLPELAFAPLASHIAKVAAGTVAMAIAVAAGAWGLGRGGSLRPRLADAVEVAALIPIGLAVYAGVSWVLRTEGWEELEPVLARFRRSPRPRRGR